MKRQRGRGRKPGGGGNGGGGNHNHGNRSLESSGPDVKIRGTATQIYEKYAQYARDAQSGGDRVRYENFLQHAEHYYRVMAASMPRDRLLAQQAQGEAGQQNNQQNPDGSMQSPSDDGGGNGHGNGNGEQPDSLKVMDSEGADDGDDGFDDEGDEQGEEADANASSGGGQDDRQDNQQGDRAGRGKRRRGRRRHPDGQQGGGDRPQAQSGNGNGGGGDTEARSALDSLARKQGALAGS